NWNGSSVSVLLGSGLGTFGPQSEIAVGANPRDVEVGDLNGDGHADLVTANMGTNTVSVLLGTGSGTFQPRTDIVSGGHPSGVAIGDLNNDWHPDLAVSNQHAVGMDNVPGTASVMLGTGTGSFGPRTDYPSGATTRAVAVADLDGDGALDLVVANWQVNTISVRRGSGKGTFGQRFDYGTQRSPTWVTVADLDGDHRPDVVIPDAWSDAITMWFGQAPVP
ncbi:MAG TPA: VCBS repeat-containing protein, partial [Acidimicrobiales bacterium]